MAAIQNFGSMLSDADTQVVRGGFSTMPWVPEFGWHTDEAEAAQDAHQPQMLAALQCFLWFFVSAAQKAWVHLAAEMQAGKTGVVNALLRLMFANARTLGIRPERVFIITGMNDNAWVKQTRERVPRGVRGQVEHNGGLARTARDLRGLAEADPMGLRNVVIIVDESHIATNVGNRPNRMVYNLLAELCPPALWTERNIRVLTISATDPAKVAAMDVSVIGTHVVRLLTSDAYQSVAKLNAAGRLRWAEDFGDIHQDSAIAEVARVVAEMPPLYHFLRCKNGKHALVETKLLASIPGCRVIQWNANERPATTGADGSVGMLEDINEQIAEAPEVHTFILLKNMFYASKTMDDTHVGVLYDRVGGRDDTNLQSLLGRACGYGKSERTIVYGSRQTVTNYVDFWQEVITGQGIPPTDIPVERLDRRMAATRVVAVNGGHALHTTHLHAAPGGRVAGRAEGGGGVVPRAAALIEDNFRASWHPFTTLDQAKTFAPSVRRPQMDVEGFYKSSAPTLQVCRYDTIIGLQSGRATSMMPSPTLRALPVNGTSDRIYVGYRTITDPGSAVFFIKRVTRVRAD